MKTKQVAFETSYAMEERPKAGSSREVHKVLWPTWRGVDEYESFVVVALTRANTVISHAVISTGGVSGTVADPKIIFRYALTLKGCAAIIVAHNHPSGAMAASQADIDLTKKLKEAGKFLEMPVLDHLILSPVNGTYLSFADEGML